MISLKDYLKKNTKKNKDENGNKDDVFSASNVAAVNREKEKHGYSSGKDSDEYKKVNNNVAKKDIDRVDEEVVLDEGVGTKTKSFAHFQDLAHELADHITHNGHVEFHTRRVGVPGGKQWHQTVSVIHNGKLGQSYSYGVFNHDKKGSDSGFGHRVHPMELDESFKDKVTSAKLKWATYPTKSNEDEYKKIKSKYLEHEKKKKLTKEDVINKVVDKYSKSEIVETSIEDKIIESLDGFSESTVNRLMSLYNVLSESNQNRFLDMVKTKEGINSLIDLSLEGDI